MLARQVTFNVAIIYRVYYAYPKLNFVADVDLFFSINRSWLIRNNNDSFDDGSVAKILTIVI